MNQINPRLQALFADLDKRNPSWRDAKVVVTDRTPAGYGPTEGGAK